MVVVRARRDVQNAKEEYRRAVHEVELAQEYEMIAHERMIEAEYRLEELMHGEDDILHERTTGTGAISGEPK